MRSSSGVHYVGLDHLRGLAAFLVFEWHFIHLSVPYDNVPAFWPLSILEEGHCGVALFMTLSGYLFAKLLDGHQVIYKWFFWNRMLRLAPLLIAVIIINGAINYHDDLVNYLKIITLGLVLPLLPNGQWSIAVEAHFYLLLPLLLFLLRRSPAYVPLIIFIAIAIRAAVLWRTGETELLASYTIFGRIDQFVLGMAAFNLRDLIKGQHVAMFAAVAAYSLFYHAFNAAGGFYLMTSYPSPSPIWIVMPTVDGLFFCLLIAYYDSTFKFRDVGVSGLLAKIGTCSYSIYLLHFFVVIGMHTMMAHVVPLTNFYVATAAATLAFCAFAPIAWISYRYYETFFLRFRRGYISSKECDSGDRSSESGRRRLRTVVGDMRTPARWSAPGAD
ncbi:acyltransferase [Bradyrhizobium sp. SSUT77]|uniref:acyltransferase family protein n=1 Tax=Bradyrhizobium sp. SSUT77 TaxID=3040603 RepID=UPI00244C711A|nr:acyltransferase [Bradyrhizobium sp. SSUT77]MDH2345077.1 acyltransferase [Bradyrhizobium sp. SSUT77]